MAHKNYVVDTNVLLNNPECLNDVTFSDGNINIPEIVITELEKFKNEDSLRGYSSRKVGRILRELRSLGNLSEGISNNYGHVVRTIGVDDGGALFDGWDQNDPDHLILKAAVQLKGIGKKGVVLVTSDVYLAIKADQCGIDTKEPSNVSDSIEYTGQKTVYCKQSIFESIASSKNKGWELSLNDVYLCDAQTGDTKEIGFLNPNEFLIIINESNEKAIRLGRYDGEKIVALQHESERPSDVKPRNFGQKFLQEALITEKGEQRLVIVEGPAGTAKTFYTLAVGARAKENGIFDRFYVTRANVEADETYGFVPGDIDEKFDGFLNPIYDNLEALLNLGKESETDKDGVKLNPGDDKTFLLQQFGIEAKPLNHMRGRSLKRRLIFVDEAQNLTRSQIKMIVTRAGEGSVVVLAGDIQQIDNHKLNRFNNGLTHAIRSMVGEKICWFVRLSVEDAERSELAKIAAKKL